MRSMTLQNPSLFPLQLRNDVEAICKSAKVTQACRAHTKSSGRKLLDEFFKDQLSSRGYSVECERLRVAENCKFDLDLLISGSNSRTAVLLEGGKAARVDLDLLKLIAWGKRDRSADLAYAAFIVSDKQLSRTITGTPYETAFDYLKRLRPLFSATVPNLTDLLIVEFKA